MPEIYEEDVADQFDYVTDWAEYADGVQAGGGGSFSSGAQEVTVVGYVAGNKLRAALRYFLGFTTIETTEPPDAGSGDPVSGNGVAPVGTGSYLLRREPPARHPQFPQLYCYTASFVGQGIDATANTVVANDSPWTDYLGATLKYTPYSKYLLTLRYKSFGRMRFLTDADMAGYDPAYAYEWLRNTAITIGPAVQALTADGSSNLTFQEGAPNNTAFPAPIAELMAKSNLTVRWHGVPHEWLSDNEYYLYPTKIITNLGGVNDADFIGLAKGTVLLLGAEFEPILYPVAPADPAQPLGGYDVTFHFEHFDPTKGVPSSEYRGHRVFPYRVDGLWYYAKREGASKELLPLVPMYKIFQHIEDGS